MDADSSDLMPQTTGPAEPPRLSVHVQRAGDRIVIVNTQRPVTPDERSA